LTDQHNPQQKLNSILHDEETGQFPEQQQGREQLEIVPAEEENYKGPPAEFCEYCNTFKFWHSHHCVICQRCVVRMDHHCPWIMGCVGYSNYRFFLLFSFYAALWLGQNNIFLYFYKDRLYNFDSYEVIFYISGTLVAIFAVFVVIMYGGLALKGLTIIEAAQRFAHVREQVLLLTNPRQPTSKG
jgi:hypothetical protein